MTAAIPPTAFYLVTDPRYFLGAVALINSLRLVGHTEPIFVLDCGLTDEQRGDLEPHAILVQAPAAAPPWLLKTVAPLRRPAEVMVLIDADMIVTRRLDDVIALASGDRVAAVEHGSDRFVPEWGELLGLGPARRQPYLSSSLVALSGEVGRRVLRLMEELQDRVDFEQTLWRRNVPGYPFLYADQCLMNAILCSTVARESIAVIDRRLEAIPPFEGLRIVDSKTLRCAYEDGIEPYALHHLTVKPWMEPTMGGVYTSLLVRLLSRRDVALRIPRQEVPLHLQGTLGRHATRALARLRRTAR